MKYACFFINNFYNRKFVFFGFIFLVWTGVYGGSIKDTIEIEEVVVTGTKVETSRNNVPMTVSVITREQIEESDESALLPIISEKVPGVFVTERGVTGFGVSGGAAGNVSIRGLGGNPTTQVLMLIDGHPQFMGMMGHSLPDAYIASDAERVEIIRGTGSILYGSNAMGGVINIITKQQQEDGIKANGRVQYGSFNTQKYMLSSGYKHNKLNVFGSINHDQTDGHRDSSDFAITNGFLKAGYDLSRQFKINANSSVANFNASDPGPVTGNAGERIDILRGEAALSLENKMKKTEGAFKMYYNFGEHDITDGWHSNDEHYGLMLYQGIKLLPSNTITVGLDAMEYGGQGSPINSVVRNENGNIVPGPTGPQFVPDEYNNQWVKMQQQAAYSFIQHTLFKKLTLNAGIRYEMNSKYGNEWIPQSGFAYNFSERTNFKGSIAEGYRPPSIRELYFFPPANDQLLPEQLINYELSWNQYWMKKTLKTELTAFVSDGENMIVKVPSSPIPIPYYRNSGDFYNQGIEFALDYKINANLRFNGNYTYIDMKQKVIATPKDNVYGSVHYKYKKASFQAKLQSIFDLYGEDTKGNVVKVEKNYNLFGLKINYKVSRYYDIFISGDNLFGQDYRINYDYTMPGRIFMTGINLHY